MERDELAEYLSALDRSDCYRVDAVLKDSPIERTERVCYVGNNGSELGPFIRKTIAREPGQGRVYEMLYHAQQVGKRFVHLPRIFECYATSSSLTVLIEFVHGNTLQEYVELNGPSGHLALRIFPLVCDAVRELHEAFDPPAIHRDLTPANIIVSDSSVTLIDLGIARIFHPEAARDTTYFGTRAYAPPEQFGFGQTDVRSDVYAMGKVLRYCVAGGEDDATTVPVDQRVEAVIGKATKLDPAQRYQSINELKAAFLAANAPVPTGDQAPSQAMAAQLSASHSSSAEQPGERSAGHPVSVEYSTAAKYRAELPANQSVIFLSDEAAPHRSVASVASSIAQNITLALGIIWDAFVLFLWAVLFITTNVAIINPTDGNELIPAWFLAFEFYALITIPSALLAYYLLDLRPFKRFFPNVKFIPRRRTWPLALVIVLGLFLLVFVVAYISGVFR